MNWAIEMTFTSWATGGRIIDSTWVGRSVVPIIRGTDILGATVFAHDITEWNEREEEGRKYRAIFDYFDSLLVGRSDCPHEGRMPTLYRPALCVIAQGCKEVRRFLSDRKSVV